MSRVLTHLLAALVAAALPVAPAAMTPAHADTPEPGPNLHDLLLDGVGTVIDLPYKRKGTCTAWDKTERPQGEVRKNVAHIRGKQKEIWEICDGDDNWVISGYVADGRPDPGYSYKIGRRNYEFEKEMRER